MFSYFSFPGRLICLHAEGNTPSFPCPPYEMFSKCFPNLRFCTKCKTTNKRFPGSCIFIFCCSVTCQVTEQIWKRKVLCTCSLTTNTSNNS